MVWFLLILCSICFVEAFVRLNVAGRIEGLKKILFKVSHTIRSPKISDCWKEKVLPRYALMLFSHSLLIFVILVVSFSLFIVFSILSFLLGGEFLNVASSGKGILLSSLVAGGYAIWRSRKTKGNYGTGSRFLHQLALGNTVVGEAAFDIERMVYASKTIDVLEGKHLFIAGLARAGTTILMRQFYTRGHFCSLTYRDMPFILAPNMWRLLTRSSQRRTTAQERAHGDGLEVDYDSPEALEEVFWRVFCKGEYIHPNYLEPMTANREIIEKFRSFVALVIKDSKARRYLSKNNNNILRLSSIAEAFPRAAIVIPFRDPIQQAYSLMNQHRRFLKIHAKEPFSKKYMTWLAHHEFGSDHRPFNFNGRTDLADDTDQLRYWLERWVDAYTYIKTNLPPQAILISYEGLCDNSATVWARLLESVDLPPNDQPVVFTKSIHPVSASLPPELVDQATMIYNELLASSVSCR